jgi:hypothetical protein
MQTKVSSENVKETDRFGGLGMDGRIDVILNWNLYE